MRERDRERERNVLLHPLDYFFAGFSGNGEVVFGLRCKQNQYIALIRESGSHVGSLCIYVFITARQAASLSDSPGPISKYSLHFFHTGSFD